MNRTDYDDIKLDPRTDKVLRFLQEETNSVYGMDFAIKLDDIIIDDKPLKDLKHQIEQVKKIVN